MKDEIAIEVRNVSKSFRVFVDKGNTLKERVLFSRRRKYDYRQVLKDISFTVKKGEAIGLVGQNGCGKSTTLKLLTKIIYPDSGTISMKGRVSSLIELGAGFHPDMSGRENIYINAAIFGLTRKEIDDRLEDIIAFSELEDFIDNPVRTYSSGMYMRLAFSVAINVDAEILLIDEILAVGDANFQIKCFNKLKEIKADGTTIVIVSHALGQIEQICERSIWIQDGLVQMEGSPWEVHPAYLDYMGKKREAIAAKEALRVAAGRDMPVQNVEPALRQVDVENLKRWGNGKARIVDVRLLNEDGKHQKIFETGKDILVKMKYRVTEKVENAVFGIGFFQEPGVRCYGTNTRLDGMRDFTLTQDGELELLLKEVPLLPGIYTVDLTIELDQGIPVDYYREVEKIEFISRDRAIGIAQIRHQWRLDENVETYNGEKENAGSEIGTSDEAI